MLLDDSILNSSLFGIIVRPNPRKWICINWKFKNNRKTIQLFIQTKQNNGDAFQVSEIKRVNNLVSDQDVFAFVGKSIRIPVSRLQKQILLNSEKFGDDQLSQVSTFSAQYSQPSSSSVPISGSQLANAFSTIDTSARQNWSGHKLKVNRGHKGRSNLVRLHIIFSIDYLRQIYIAIFYTIMSNYCNHNCGRNFQ